MDPTIKVIFILLIIAIVIAKLVSLLAIRARMRGYAGGALPDWLWKLLTVIVAGVVLWWLWPAETVSLKAPAPGKVWEFFKNYWMWMIFILAILFFASSALQDSWAKAAKGLVVVIAVTLIGAMIVHGIWGESSSSQQTQQQLAKPMLKMPPNGDSARISPDAGYSMVFTGSGFEHHVVYADGNDCIVGNVVNPCKDGPILHQYVRDTTGKSNSVTYKFVR